MSKVKYTLPFIIAIFATSLYSFSGEPTLALKEFGHYAFQKEIKPDYSINSQNIVLKSFDNISLEHLDATIIKLSSFPTRYYLTESGVQAMHWIKEHWQGLTQKRTDIRVQEFKHGYHNQPTIILTVEGYDPDLKNEIIILGGHGDSINTHSNDIHALAPGADDNAAGIAVLSELIRRLVEMDYKPQRTIQFIAYAAEEPQERSSYELTRWYRENEKKVIGVINFDGVNYKTGEYDLVLIDDRTNEDQNLFIGRLIDTYLQKKWTWQTCGYACSDHASWDIEGYRASFPFESLLAIENPNIHTAHDTFDKSGNNSLHAAMFVKLGLAYLIELDK